MTTVTVPASQPTTTASRTAPARVAVVGIHGHGATHLRHLAQLAAHGTAELAATVDLRPPATELGVPHYTDLGDCLAGSRPDVVVLATPIATHAALTTQALRGGADVLLEKPTATSLAELGALRAEQERTGHLVQVGFQALGSQAVPLLRAMLDAGAVGQVHRVGIVGTWLRRRSYWQRARWAGRRELSGVPVVDGVVTNPLAHSFASALAILGCGGPGGVHEVTLDQYHVNDIQADDTSAVRLATAAGVDITAALTLCARVETDPHLTVYGSEGAVRLWYTRDEAVLLGADGRPVEHIEVGRTDLLTNLLAARRGEEDLIVPLEATAGFMTLLDAVRRAPDPRAIDPTYVRWHGLGEEPAGSQDGHSDPYPVLQDVEEWCAYCASHGLTFAEAGAPWARLA